MLARLNLREIWSEERNELKEMGPVVFPAGPVPFDAM
jgi:hypothetical protein